ncbi:hypothetical protein GQR58_024923 [Nymphon striatum]|nr:hypothetical protein GQR58_024923 [Nymphon striatum]
MHHYAKFQRPICKDAPVYSEQTHTPFWPPFWIQYGDDTQDPHGSLSYIIMHHYAKFQRPICKDAPVFNKLLNEKKKKIITHNENTPVRPSFRSVEKIVSRNRLYKRTALLPLPKPDPNPLLTPDTLLVPQPAHPTYPTPKHSRAIQAGHIGRIPSTSSRDVACCAKHCSGDQKLANLGQHVASLQAPSLCLLR